MDIVMNATMNYANSTAYKIIDKLEAKVAENPSLAVIIILCLAIVAFSKNKLITLILVILLLIAVGFNVFALLK